jgi:TRAP-type C4-dicarboxylate transport system permease small subunit
VRRAVPGPTADRAARVLRAVDAVAWTMALASGALFLLVSFYITLDVISRKFFHFSTAVTDEYGGYALAVGGMWSLAHALRAGAHVRIDVLLPHLPAPVRALLGYAALVVMTFFASIVAVYAWRLTLDSLAIDARAMSFVRTPLVVPQGLMAVGFTVLGLEALVILAVGVAASLRLGRLAPLAGMQAGDEGEVA